MHRRSASGRLAKPVSRLGRRTSRGPPPIKETAILLNAGICRNGAGPRAPARSLLVVRSLFSALRLSMLGTRSGRPTHENLRSLNVMDIDRWLTPSCSPWNPARLARAAGVKWARIADLTKGITAHKLVRDASLIENSVFGHRVAFVEDRGWSATQVLATVAKSRWSDCHDLVQIRTMFVFGRPAVLVGNLCSGKAVMGGRLKCGVRVADVTTSVYALGAASASQRRRSSAAVWTYARDAR